MQRKVESGEALTREDIVRPLREDARNLQRIEALRRLPPTERREALRRLPPEERRALIEAWRAGRAARQGTQAPTAEPAPDALPADPTPAPQPSSEQ